MAGRIPQAFINDLLARADIVQVIESHVSLKKAGKDYQALCPFHHEKTPSFTVSPSKQMYYCFGCGVGGNVIGFLMEYERLEFVDAIEELASRYGLTVPYEKGQHQTQQQPEAKNLYELTEQVARFYQQQLRLPQAKRAVDYLKQRGLTGEISKQFGIGYVLPGWDNMLVAMSKNPQSKQQLFTVGLLIQKENGSFYDRFRDRIIFPIRDRRGRVVGFGGRTLGDEQPKYLNSPETPIFHKGLELYGLYEAKRAHRHLDCLLVVEGYMDVVALAQHGISYAVATMGTATTPQHVERLFRTCSKIVFCFDGDRAGNEAAWRALEVVMPMLHDEWQPRFMFLPQGEDPDSLIRQEGKDRFEQRIDLALSLSTFFFDHLSKAIDLNQTDGRSGLAKEAMEYIQTINGAFAREQFIQQLAQYVHMDVTKLEKFMHQEKMDKNAVLIESTKIKLSPMRLVMMLLLQYPQLIAEVSQPLPDIETAGANLLKELIELLKTNASLSTGLILEHWRDRPDYSLMVRLATMEHMVPEDGLSAEFKSVLNKLKQEFNENRIERLMTKASSLDGLSSAEKSELQQLLMKERILETGN